MQVTNPLIASQIAVTQGAAQPKTAAIGGKPAFDPQQFMQNVVQNSNIAGQPSLTTPSLTNSPNNVILGMSKVDAPFNNFKNLPPDVLRNIITTIKEQRSSALLEKSRSIGNSIFRKRAIKRYAEMIDGNFLDD